MPQETREAFVSSLRSALRQPLGENNVGLTAVLSRRHPAEIVDALYDLPRGDALAVFNWLDNARAAEVLDSLDQETVRFLTDNLPAARVADLLDRLPVDDAAEIVAGASPDRAESLLKGLTDRDPVDAAGVRKLLSFDEDSAGRLMTDKFAAVSPDMKAADVLEYVRTKANELETINDIYVLDERRIPLGVTAIKRVLTARPDQPIREFMTPDPISVHAETPQWDTAQLISRYDLLTMPVTSDEGAMIGIVTIDDTVDVLVEGFNEEYMRSVGSDAEELEKRSPTQIARLRMPWIMATMLIELMAGIVIHVYDATLQKYLLLASFMPIISAISGNTGLQSAAIIIRGLSSGQVTLAGWKQAVTRQAATTVILAAACGLVLGLIGGAWDKHWSFGLVVFLGMFASVNIAGIVGTVVPLLSKRAGFDPALTAGPFETAFQDVVGISIFLSLASFLLHWLN